MRQPFDGVAQTLSYQPTAYQVSKSCAMRRFRRSAKAIVKPENLVMPGLVPGIHVFPPAER